MNFDQAVKIILMHEGGYVWDSNDPGGETNFGISSRAYPNLDIKELTKEDAIKIYRKDFWDEMRLDEMPEQLRLVLFDCAVNQGKNRAIRLLQGALGVKQDGILGPMTLLAFREAPIGLVFSNFVQMRFSQYSNSPNWASFGRGWMKRLLQVVLESVEIV